MGAITTDEILILNNIIDVIYNVEKFDDMRKQYLNLIREIIPYKTASFYLGKKKNNTICLCNAVSIDTDMQFLKSYEDYYGEIDYCKEFFCQANSNIYRYTDLIDSYKREKTEILNDYMIPIGAFFSAGASIICNKQFLGTITLFRSKIYGDFTDKELFILKLMNTHLEKRLIQEKNNLKELEDIINKFNLTKREIEIINCLCNGFNNKQISNELLISTYTVKNHIKNIYKKTEVNNRTQLINTLYKGRILSKLQL